MDAGFGLAHIIDRDMEFFIFIEEKKDLVRAF